MNDDESFLNKQKFHSDHFHNIFITNKTTNNNVWLSHKKKRKTTNLFILNK